MNGELLQIFRKKLKESYVLGLFMKTSDPGLVEAAGYAGMDFAILDTEHGPVNTERLQDLIRAAQNAGTVPIVRAGNFEMIAKALDLGAAGIQIPKISSADEAKRAVREAKFFPKGNRGLCRFVRAAHYSALSKEEYLSAANNALVILQLEGTEAVEHLDEIMSVDGIDIIFIGPYDLSQSLGFPGEITHPLVLNEMRKILAAAQKNGLAIGTFVDSNEMLKMWSSAGINYFAYSVDMGIFCDACRQIRERAEYPVA